MKIEVAKELGDDIVTREHGKRLNALVHDALRGTETVTVDFDGLQVTSVSFFDEAFGRLAQAIGQEGFAATIRLQNIDPFDLALVNDIVVSRSREKTRGKRSAGVSVRPRSATAHARP